MKVLVTGGAGYVGASLLGALAARSQIDAITLYDNLSRQEFALFSQGSSSGKAELVVGDILDGWSLRRALEGTEVVIHLAAAVHHPTSDRDGHIFDQVNNWGSAAVAGAIEEAPDVRRVIYLSSVAVYGSGATPSDETSPTAPSTFYGVTKLRGEEHFRRLHDPEVVVVRSGNVYGLNSASRYDSVINQMVFAGRFSGRVRVEGSGEQTRSFVPVTGLADALAELTVAPSVSGTHNFVSATYSVRQIAETLLELAPTTDMLFVDQDMQLSSVEVLPGRLWESLQGPPAPLRDELAEMWSALRL